MTFTPKNADNPKFSIDLSKNKYQSRYDRLLNILFFAKELPNDLHTHLNMSYHNYRKTLSILGQRGLIKRFSNNGLGGYQLTLKGKRLTREGEYRKYQDCIREEDDRHLSIQRRNRRRNFAYLYALFDRAGIPYESFSKPPLSDMTYSDERVYFYTALEVKQMLGVESTAFKGSRLLGFFIGRGRVIPVYRTKLMLNPFGSHEALVPMLLSNHFSVPINSAVLICSGDGAVIHISQQIIEGTGTDPKKAINTAEYQEFFILPSNDSFLSRFEDLFADEFEDEQEIIRQFGIDTSDMDGRGIYRYKAGTGFINDHPVLVCAGNVNIVKLRRFVLNAKDEDAESYIICKMRDEVIMNGITKDMPITVIAT